MFNIVILLKLTECEEMPEPETSHLEIPHEFNNVRKIRNLPARLLANEAINFAPREMLVIYQLCSAVENTSRC